MSQRRLPSPAVHQSSATSTYVHEIMAPRPSLSSHSFFNALILALAILATCGLFLRSLVAAISSDPTPLATFFTLLRTSPWSLATFADYLTGALILATWLSSRPLSSPLFASCLPFVGNPLAYIHTATVLLKTRTPASMAPLSPPILPTSASLSRPYVTYISVITVAYFAVLARALLSDDLIVGYHELKAEPLVYATFLDNLMGIAMAIMIIAAREDNLITIALWSVSMGLLGHGVFGLYALRVAAEARNWGVGVGEAWATGKRKSDGEYV